MFSGIVEAIGIVNKIEKSGTSLNITIGSNFSSETYIDQSIAHNGVCLTVTHQDDQSFKVTAIKETLDKTNLGRWKEGDIVNLERSLFANARVDGHFVQGHVDTTVICTDIQQVDGSWYFHFSISPEWQKYIVKKGSICINGVSLTIVDIDSEKFSVAIIPYTYEHTNFKAMKIGDVINIEFDVLGKYIIKYLDNIHLANAK